jgi:WD40 repeat protein
VLAVALEVGRVEIRDTNALDRVLTVLPFEGPVKSIRFNADGTLLVAVSDRVVRVYDAM